MFRYGMLKTKRCNGGVYELLPYVTLRLPTSFLSD